MNEKDKNEILSLSQDLGELALDSILKDGLFKDLPLIGSVFSVSKLLLSVNDRMLLVRLIHFINDLNLKTQEEIDDFKAKFFKNEDYSKIGSKLLLIIEKADSATKIKWLAKCLRLFIDQEIDKKHFLRMSSIINSAYTEDVEKISIFNKRAEITSFNDLIETYILDHLFSLGLLESHGFDGGTNGENSGTIYALNEFGCIMNQKIV
ncbi:MAG: hypothetical protein A2X19_09515 [Bacteroidetes bacterium GWE2_39_28]|nr:MAG: hypothetical protein A2X19_09515 [Bacteroidetes bacterium GWE2_39_28]OFY12371.1 MAG: hypothetical protein A2X16_07250 [Bacteroidetes bacterium GWF2_39_10]OFZ12022.1 MAG: hypothetical protein A2465_08720 [Bacteroidetes bacterium RIFOXYC2_FULL_39_11]HCT94994.1 hypothetical protein [Rikenellaceae bacterium]